MKQTLFIVLASVVLTIGCKKDDKKAEPFKCATCVTTPEAKAAYDANSGGVYKGVIVGSTGTIALYLHNTGTEVKALVAFDGKSATLSTNDLATWQPGQPINNALFTGMINADTVQAYFSVGANGQNPTVNVMIPGHTVVVAVYKETSTALIKNFEGTYAGGSSGIFNMTFNGTDYAIVSDAGTVQTGSLVNGKVEYSVQGLEINGTFQGSDNITGTWKDTNNGKQGTWAANRTL